MEKAFTSLAEAAGQYDRTLSSAKNDKKAELIGLLEKLDDYITTVSNGDKTMLLSSGFDIAGIKGASQELEPIEKLNVEIGPTGQAITRVSKRCRGQDVRSPMYTRSHTTRQRLDKQLPGGFQEAA